MCQAILFSIVLEMKIDTLLSPRELPVLAERDLRTTTCVVFDILRATSTFVTALRQGAEKIIPVSEIGEAIASQRENPHHRLAGERQGARIRAAQSGGIDFDFGNSPREFTTENVRGQTIVSTTTNGTRALRACAKAKTVLAASFLNLLATTEFLRLRQPAEILLICAGTREAIADEDVLAAGAIIESLHERYVPRPTLTETSTAALKKYRMAKADLLTAISHTTNGQRLLAIPELHDDVAFCAQRDIFSIIAALGPDGALRGI
jgi:2-phosphosulfolactate phosphatase